MGIEIHPHLKPKHYEKTINKFRRCIVRISSHRYWIRSIYNFIILLLKQIKKNGKHRKNSRN